MEETQKENTATQADSGKATLSAGLGGVLGVKAGMTQVYDDKGAALAVTVVEIKPNTVTQVKMKEKEGYSAVQVGFLPKKESRLTKTEKGHFKKSGQAGFYHTQEFRFADDAAIAALKPGTELTAEFLKEGDLVDVSAVSKGKGFQGVMKRHNYAGGRDSHGHSISHRQIGSIGNRADPGKVFKGKPMAGHMGHKKVSIQNLKVVKIDLERGVVLIHGSVPGPRSGIVTIRKAVKAGV